MLSPVRYTQRKFRAGGTQGSIFSLVAATLGSGTITFPYAVKMNGIILGPLLIAVGAAISYFSGMLIVSVASITGKDRYEDMARHLYNKRIEKITCVLNIICLMGFTMSYIVFIKGMVPEILMDYIDNLPSWLDKSYTGEAVWCTIFTFGILFPLSIPRTISALRYSSLFGVLCSIYLVLAVIIVFWVDHKLNKDPIKNFGKAKLVEFTFDGIVNSVPLIIFAYMY